MQGHWFSEFVEPASLLSPLSLADVTLAALPSNMANALDSTPALPTAADVDIAAGRLAGVALRTPLISSPVLDALAGGRVFLKAETLQRTGFVRFRGASTARAGASNCAAAAWSRSPPATMPRASPPRRSCWACRRSS
jgi:hypothetical protein